MNIFSPESKLVFDNPIAFYAPNDMFNTHTYLIDFVDFLPFLWASTRLLAAFSSVARQSRPLLQTLEIPRLDTSYSVQEMYMLHHQPDFYRAMFLPTLSPDKEYGRYCQSQ
jgi:hypothetical protein